MANVDQRSPAAQPAALKGTAKQPDETSQGQAAERHSSSQVEVPVAHPGGDEDTGYTAHIREGDTGSDSDADGTARSSGQAGAHVLKDGTTPQMCLWAVQLNLLHPVTRAAMELKIDHPVVLYRGICDIEASN